MSALTAEQVREAVESNSWAETSSIREFNDSSWQAIADELNTRAERTCKLTLDGTDGNFGCSECLENIPPLSNFCPNCGCKVVGK